MCLPHHNVDSIYYLLIPLSVNMNVTVIVIQIQCVYFQQCIFYPMFHAFVGDVCTKHLPWTNVPAEQNDIATTSQTFHHDSHVARNLFYIEAHCFKPLFKKTCVQTIVLLRPLLLLLRRYPEEHLDWAAEASLAGLLSSAIRRSLKWFYKTWRGSSVRKWSAREEHLKPISHN